MFKTFIVKFIGNQEYSFYNVEDPQDGICNRNQKPNEQDIGLEDYHWLKDRHNEEENPFTSSIERHMNMEGSSSVQQNRLQEHAQALQQSINDSNVIGNEFNKQMAEAKIELDFINNEKVIASTGTKQI